MVPYRYSCTELTGRSVRLVSLHEHQGNQYTKGHSARLTIHKPYCDWLFFKNNITDPLKHGGDTRGVKKLQAAFKSIALRRTKQSRIDGRSGKSS